MRAGKEEDYRGEKTYRKSIDSPGDVRRWIGRRCGAVAAHGVAERVARLLHAHRQISLRQFCEKFISHV